MKPETLFDSLYKASFRNKPIDGWVNNAALRDALTKANRFVLTDDMSTMLGHLSIEAFIAPVYSDENRRFRQIEAFRTGARLPFETVWIEYSLRHCQRIVNSYMQGRQVSVEDLARRTVPAREGWLLQRHPQLENAVIAHIVSHSPDLADENGDDTWTFPVAYAWTTDMDTVLPWRSVPYDKRKEDLSLSAAAVGIHNYDTGRVSVVDAPLFDFKPQSRQQAGAVGSLIEEWTGVVRRMMAFLSTINDVPTVTTRVRPSRGFFAKGRIRPFLAHTTIHLTIPAKRYSTFAKKAVHMAHRRGGPVKGHWRDDFRRPYQTLCNHAYDADEGHRWCTLCNGRQIWIRDHVRGDAAEGFVTHDYAVNAGAPSP